MVYEAFLNNVTEQIKQNLGEGYDLTLHKIPKNNGMILDGLCITRGKEQIAPAIYLNTCYSRYLAGQSIEDLAAEVVALYQGSYMPPDMDYSKLAQYIDMKPRIACRLINAASNQEYLKEIPHVLWLDLAIVFYLCVHEDDSGLMTAAIHNTHLDIWGISLEELKETAFFNTPLLFPPVITSMAKIIEDLGQALKENTAAHPGMSAAGESGPLQPDISSVPEFPDPGQSAPFFVLSNQSGIHGASCILYPDVIKNFAELMEKDIIILPSSIHEVLLLPDEGDISCNEMSRLVTHINHTEVPEEDRLSNQVYLYSRIHHTLTLASSSTAPIC